MIISPAYAAGAEGAAFYATPDFWVLVAFVLVVGFAFRPLGRAIGAMLDTRAEKIRAKIEQARSLREDSQAMLAEYQRKQRDALQEAEAIVQHAREEAARMKTQAEKDMAESITRRERQAMDRIAQAEAQALAQVRNMAVDIAMRAAGQMIAENVKAEQANHLIDDSIKGLPEKFH